MFRTVELSPICAKSPAKRARKKLRACWAARVIRQCNSRQVCSRSDDSSDRLNRLNESILKSSGSSGLYRTERENHFAVKLVENLSQAGVDGAETAENSLPTRKRFETHSSARVVAPGEQKK